MSQLRELALEPKGHARHRDHERGFDMSRAEEEYALTTVSLSFPISRNDGKSISSAPWFWPCRVGRSLLELWLGGRESTRKFPKRRAAV